MTPQPDEHRTLQAARSCLTQLLPALAPFQDQEVRTLTLQAGLLSLTAAVQPQETELIGRLRQHVHLLRRKDSLQAQPTAQPSAELGRDLYGPALTRMQQLAQQVGLPWFTRQPLIKAKMQVSYRVTAAFERAVDEAWHQHAPRGSNRNALQMTLVLAYLAVPEFRQRVRAVQDVRYGQARQIQPLPRDTERVAQLLHRCSIPSRGAPTLRHHVVQLSYRTTPAANKALRRSLADEGRTMAYLHIDLLALYLMAPDLRALIDHALGVRGVE